MENNLNTLEKEYQDLLKQKENIELKIKEIMFGYAELKSPFHPGDIIDICGYSYKGLKGQVQYVEKCTAFCDNTKLSWKVSGRVLKKDGSLGDRMFSFEEHDYKDK